MTVSPSCPVLVVHDNDSFRQALIAQLDRQHFTVTYMSDGPEAVKALQEKEFNVVLLSVNLKTRRGMQVLEYLRTHRQSLKSSVIIIGEADPELRSRTSLADETLLRPVDPTYVAERARAYCGD